MSLTCQGCGHRNRIETTENGKLALYRCGNCQKIAYFDNSSHFDFINNKGETVRAYYAASKYNKTEVVGYEKVG